MLKTIVVLHRVLRDGSTLSGQNSKLSKIMSQERSLPPHWTDAAIISAYCKYIGLRLTSTFLQGQEVHLPSLLLGVAFPLEALTLLRHNLCRATHQAHKVESTPR
jgi:hypothetical protein